jgi:3-oxoacyl-(acyl-carrier-protein) synthase
MDEQIRLLQNEGPRSLSPFAIPKIISDGASGMISIAYGIQGPSFSVASACASGSDGIGIASHLIRTGLLDAAIAGGADSPITALAIGGFDRIGAVSHRTDFTPSPFSAGRDGLIVGEGAGVLVLESLDHARSRKAEILGELIGYAATSDAFHVTAPTEDGRGSARAINRALDDAKLNATDIDYINAHGTGTSLNDAAETKAIKLALGDHAHRLPISSTKSMTGHMMGATGAVEAIICLKAIHEQVVPPTINYTGKDEICDLDYVPNAMRDAKLVTVMSHAFGFGGHNSVLILRAFSH